jgi:hypothetical protein
VLRALLVLSAVVAVAAIACNDGSSSSELESYLLTLEELDTEFEEAAAEREAQLNEAFAAAETDEEVVDVYRQSFVSFQDVVEGFIRDLEGLDPPEEAEAIHEQAVSSGNDVLVVLDELATSGQDVQSVEEAETLASDMLADEAFAQFDEACIELQALADENDVEISLNCQEAPEEAG